MIGTIYTQVPIRTVSYLRGLGLDVEDIFLKKGKIYQLYYMHHQTKKIAYVDMEDDPANMIGTVSNLRIIKDILVGDVTLNPLNKLSVNFIGVIDNFRLKYNKSINEKMYGSYGRSMKCSHELLRLYIYDKEYKKEVDDRVATNYKQQ